MVGRFPEKNSSNYWTDNCFYGMISTDDLLIMNPALYQMNYDGIIWACATKPVFGVSDKVRLKPVSSATVTS